MSQAVAGRILTPVSELSREQRQQLGKRIVQVTAGPHQGKSFSVLEVPRNFGSVMLDVGGKGEHFPNDHLAVELPFRS